VKLDADSISSTIDLLCRRVETRFPGSGLAGVCRNLLDISRRHAATAAWIARPNLPLRLTVTLLIALIVLGIAFSVATVRTVAGPLTLPELVQALEAGVNDVLFVAAAVFFLVTAESRIKRRRALAAIHELRALAHVVDMHQLTKDPEFVLDRGRETGVLPPRGMSRFELSRYLDYCSEALSLTGKLAALYVQEFDDPVALAAVNEVEELTTGLSRKIWQKLMILYTTEGAAGSGTA
jgi:hypothetical protein